jgi:hypothetical protein
LDNDVAAAAAAVPKQPAVAASLNNRNAVASNNEDGDDDEDSVSEMVVKSQNTLLRESLVVPWLPEMYTIWPAQPWRPHRKQQQAPCDLPFNLFRRLSLPCVMAVAGFQSDK